MAHTGMFNLTQRAIRRLFLVVVLTAIGGVSDLTPNRLVAEHFAAPPLALRNDPRHAFRLSVNAPLTTKATVTSEATAPLPAARRTLGISAKVSPAPYGEWNNTYAVVSFSCTGATNCTSPVTVTTEGAAQEIPGTASDGVTDENTSAIVNIDFTPPAVNITSPISGSTTSSAITLNGTVSDSLSGLNYVTCNGIPATVDDGNVECSVDLQKGRNAVVLTAVDLAGNSSSKSIRVVRTGTPTSLSITPGKRLIKVADTRTLSVVDDFGQNVTGLSWSSDDTNVATVSTVGTVTTLTAIGAGTATITASGGGLSADLALTVASSALAAGDVAWQSPPPSGSYTIDAVYPGIVTTDVPDLFALDYNDTDGTRTARALTTAGEQLWQEAVPGDILLADVFGGLIAATPTGIARVAGPDGAASWRFDTLGGIVSSWVQSPDGTLFGVEQSSAASEDRFLIAVDGSTGLTKFRTTLPQGDSSTLNIDCFSGFSNQSANAANTSDLTIGEDGSVSFEVGINHTSWDYLPCGTGAGSRDYSLSVWNVTTTGTATTTQLWNYSNSGPVNTAYEAYYGGDVAPDGLGNVVAAWQHVTTTSDIEAKMSRVAGGSSTDYSVDPDDNLEMVANDGVGYFRSDEGIEAVDLTSFSPLWTYETASAHVLVADPTGAVMLYDDDSNSLIPVDNSGNAGTPVSVGYVENLSTAPAFGYWYGVGYDDMDNQVIVATVGPKMDDPTFAFSQARGGNPQRQRGPLQKFTAARPEAIRVLRRYILDSNTDHVEFGGIVCQKNGIFEANVPTVGWKDAVIPGPCRRGGSTPIGLYHTHTDNSWYSGADTLCAKNGGCGGYSATEIGAHHPSWLGISCGLIAEHTYDGEPNDEHSANDPNWYTEYTLAPGVDCPY